MVAQFSDSANQQQPLRYSSSDRECCYSRIATVETPTAATGRVWVPSTTRVVWGVWGCMRAYVVHYTLGASPTDEWDGRRGISRAYSHTMRLQPTGWRRGMEWNGISVPSIPCCGAYRTARDEDGTMEFETQLGPVEDA